MGLFESSGFLLGTSTWIVVLGLGAITLFLGYVGSRIYGWTLFFALALWGLGAPVWLWVVLG